MGTERNRLAAKIEHRTRYMDSEESADEFREECSGEVQYYYGMGRINNEEKDELINIISMQIERAGY